MIPALIILFIAIMVALVGAFAWQKVSGNDEDFKSQSELLFPSKASSESSSSKPEASGSSQADSGAADSGASAPAASDASTPASQGNASQPASSVSKPVNSSALVPEGERVNSSYFDDAMFVGDSITDGILAYELMQNTTVISHTGINPDSIRNKAVFRNSAGNQVTCLQAMAEHADAKKIYLMLGANSSAWMDHDLFLEYYETFVKSVQGQHPNAIIYLQSITPINEPKFKVKYSGQDLDNAKIQTFNDDIMKLAERLGVYYLNVSEALQDSNGQLPDDATSDGMHFSTQYYQKWFDYLKTHTAQ